MNPNDTTSLASILIAARRLEHANRVLLDAQDQHTAARSELKAICPSEFELRPDQAFELAYIDLNRETNNKFISRWLEGQGFIELRFPGAGPTEKGRVALEAHKALGRRVEPPSNTFHFLNNRRLA